MNSAARGYDQTKFHIRLAVLIPMKTMIDSVTRVVARNALDYAVDASCALIAQDSRDAGATVPKES